MSVGKLGSQIILSARGRAPFREGGPYNEVGPSWGRRAQARLEGVG